MSPENPDAEPPAPPPRTFSPATLMGVACFAAGLLLVAGGVLLAGLWLVTANPIAGVIGVPLALLGIGVNITGLVLLYRGETRPAKESGDHSENP